MQKTIAFRHLYNAIRHKSAVVGVIGVGTVGLSLSKIIAKAGFKVYGFDTNSQRIKEINNARVPNLVAVDTFSSLSKCDIICVCVPTPVTARNNPDLRYIKQSAMSIAHYTSGFHLIIIESSINIGATRKFFARTLQKKSKSHYFIGYSPERIDPGNTRFTLSITPKIVAGIDKESLKLTQIFYKKFIKKVITASSIETAELTKLFENTFRLVNISLVHELSRLTQKLHLDIREVVKLAETKPFGFLAHYPSIGVGGHCIPVDPYYLLSDAKSLNLALPIVSSALEKNKKRPRDIVSFVEKIIGSVKNKKILMIGITYKKNVADIRESAALHVWRLLEKKGGNVSYHDPLIPQYKNHISLSLSTPLLNSFDVAIIATNHSTIDVGLFEKSVKPIIDTTDFLKDKKNSHIISI